MVRTTLNIEAAVLSELKRRAKRQRRPLGDIASEELARAFEWSRRPIESPLKNWKTYDMGEPSVPLGDHEALQDFLDRSDAAADGTDD